MSKQTLLLNASYEVLSFISEKRAIKLLIKDKAEIISNWEAIIAWGNGKINHPSVLRLKNLVKRNYYNSNFSRKALVKRDKNSCQYCSKKLSPSSITIDHVVPRAQGGITSFYNCVVSCQLCNNKKADRTPEQAGMKLLTKPSHPSFSITNYFEDNSNHWHPSWNYFLSNL